MAQWKQYSGMWTRQQQMQAVSASTWTGIYSGSTLFAFGDNSYGQLGDGTVVLRSSPVQIGSSAAWRLISVGSYHMAAIKPNNSLWMWGRNDRGQLGQNDLVNRSSPVQVGALTNWSKISCGRDYSLAIKSDGTLWSWGTNTYGELGLNTGDNYTRKSSPTQVGNLTTWSDAVATTWVSHAIKTDGTMWGWGYNPDGNIGDNTTIFRSSPVQIGNNTNWLALGCKALQSSAINTSGAIFTWGANSQGQLGQNDTVYRSSPTQVGSLTSWTSIKSAYSAAAIKNDGTAWGWGWNYGGPLGLNNTTPLSSPVQISASANWLSWDISDYTLFFIQQNGTLWACGRQSSNGDLGVGDTVDRSSPVQVGNLTSWSAVSANNSSSAALQNVYST